MRTRQTSSLHHLRPTNQRTQRSSRRTTTSPTNRKILPHRTPHHRRTRLRPTRHPRRRTFLPSPHRPRRKIDNCRRNKPPIQRMDQHHHRPQTRRRSHRPTHLQRPHHRNRHQQLPTQNQPNKPGPKQMITPGPIPLDIPNSRKRVALGVSLHGNVTDAVALDVPATRSEPFSFG